MTPIILRTKYAFHAISWLLEPDVILDVGSMDGADARKFKRIMPSAEVVAFEANPHNYSGMCADERLRQQGIRIVNRLVSCHEGNRTFFIQKPKNTGMGINRGTSSAMRRSDQDMETEEVKLDTVRLDSFLKREYPNKERVAVWIDVEGHAYEVLEGLRQAVEHVYLIHVEVETREIWPGQKIESEILALAKGMGLIPIAHGAHEVQRDMILIKESWYIANRKKIAAALRLSKCIGPILSKGLMVGSS